MNISAVMPKTKPLNVLLVEDDDGDVKGVQRAFQKAKIANSIIRAVDGIEALKILKETGSQLSPCIILVDLNLPRMNGIEFIQVLRADNQLHRSVVFVLTTSKREEDKAAAYDLNVAGYIVKAAAGADFLKLVNLMHCYWRVVEMP